MCQGGHTPLTLAGAKVALPRSTLARIRRADAHVQLKLNDLGALPVKVPPHAARTREVLHAAAPKFVAGEHLLAGLVPAQPTQKKVELLAAADATGNSVTLALPCTSEQRTDALPTTAGVEQLPSSRG